MNTLRSACTQTISRCSWAFLLQNYVPLRPALGPSAAPGHQKIRQHPEESVLMSGLGKKQGSWVDSSLPPVPRELWLKHQILLSLSSHL